jgi:Tfp pilus assembly protein PilX
MMNKTIKNEEGFVLVASLMMLMVLMIIGIAATNTTTLELQISGNDKVQKMDFYAAESGWQRGVQWLEDKVNPPDRVTGAAASETVLSQSEDSALTSRTIPTDLLIENKGNFGAAGSGGNYRTFTYQITSTANQEQVVEVVVQKIFKIGY